jgi:hypothetical protein
MKLYKVLWIDDDFNKDFDRLAYQKGLELIHFKTSREGMNSLEIGLQTYDAVILDGLAFNESEDEEHSIDGLINSLTKISTLRQDKWIPVFVFTGELNKMEYQGDLKWIEKFDVPIVIKGVDNKGFINDLKLAADKQETTQLKHKYPNAFALCEDAFIGNKEFKRILKLVKDIEAPEDIINQQDALLPIRKILEAIFDKLHKIGLIPDEIQNGRGAINGASIFIAGSNKTYHYHQELIHPVVAESIRHILNLTQDASHNEGTKLKADSYLTESNNTFLYQALCFTMLDVLAYIKPFIVLNNDKVENLSKWEIVKINTPETGVCWISGIVIRIAKNGWGTFQDENNSPTISIMPKMIDENKLVVNQKIEILTKQSLDGSKTHIKEIKTN